MTKAEAGQLGGLATFKKYGKKHMRTIGKSGAAKFWTIYHLIPCGTSNFAIARRDNGEVIGFMQKWTM